MKNLKFLGVALGAPLIMIACVAPSEKTESDPTPLRLLIGDGGVRIEESYSHPQGEEGRATAAFTAEHEKFKASQTEMPGKSWVEESSEYSLLPALKSQIECHVTISREKLERAPAASHESYTYSVEVKVKDGIKNGPFETVINGEGEGLILLGEYPVNNFQSAENLVVNETVVESWFYETEGQAYEIVKKMGDDLFLKKTLSFDPYLKKVSKIKYEILKGEDEEADQQRAPLAHLTCQV